MLKLLSSLVIMLMFSGCAYTWAEFQDGYKQAKVIYKDVKYVVYEVAEEKKNLSADLEK